MAKGVLGNDPFLRGAALRAPWTAPPPPPSGTARAAATPKAHAASPELIADVAAQPPTAHFSSPRLIAEHVTAQPLPFRARAAGALGVARKVLGQAFASPAVSRTLLAAEGLWRAASSAIGVSTSVDLDDYGRDSRLVRSLQSVCDFLYDRYWRIRVEGANHVPSGPAILVANHSGALPFDGPMVAQALARERGDLRDARWLVEDQLFHAPFLGILGNRLGAIRACPENALRLLAEGRPLIVFPEGVHGIGKLFKDRYQLKRFGRGGFIKVALRTGAPVIPVAVVGAEEAMPVLYKLPGSFLGVPYLPLTPLGLLPLPARWSIRFGEPIDLGGATAADEHDLPRVQRLTERTRESIQGMLTALLKERPSVF